MKHLSPNLIHRTELLIVSFKKTDYKHECILTYLIGL